MTRQTMDKEKSKFVKRPDVLRKLNAENLLILERGLLGDIPVKLRAPLEPVRGQSTDLVVSKPSGFLTSCLPSIPDSPGSDKFPDEDGSPLKKSFSFREKFSRLSFLSKKEKYEKSKWKPIVEDETHETLAEEDVFDTGDNKMEFDNKSNKRFWLFRNKYLTEKKENEQRRQPYQRSKSFEFLPRALDVDEVSIRKNSLTKTNTYACGRTDTLGDAWESNDSLFFSNNDNTKDDGIFLQDFNSESPNNHSSLSTVNSESSGLVINIFKRESVQDLLDEFNKAVDMFSENYLSDCEPYTKVKSDISVSQKRKSNSFSTIPSPKVMHAHKVSEVSEEFKKELSQRLSEKQAAVQIPLGVRSARRGSVTDWFVLEDPVSSSPIPDSKKYWRKQKKPMNRVRRMSSTKYWITPEECAVYSRDQRPPFVIPRIPQYTRAPRYQNHGHSYTEDSTKEGSIKSRSDWSPGSERSRADLDHSFSKANSDSPPFSRINKRLGGSTENLLANLRRPNHLNLPASSSGDSLDVEVRETRVPQGRGRKSKSMMTPKLRMRSPIPAPRVVLHQPVEAPIFLEAPVKRTKFTDNGKKVRKNWMECYMILTPTALLFYKDLKSYHASKAARSPPSPGGARAELVLALRHAHVVLAKQMHTRRYTRSLVVEVDYDEYLVQVETEDAAKRLLSCIQNVIYSLGPPTIEDYPPKYQSSTTDLESLGRTPPVSRHNQRNKQKVGGSSNEDLSDSTESKSHVKSRLKKFFARRPAMEVLVKKGIYKDEPVFGRNLEEVCPATSPRIPEFVVACVREIEANEENMCTDGLYRASGNLSQVQKIRLEVDQNNTSVIENNTDIHVLTGSLKLFFRELKEPLIPCSMFDRVLSACSIKPKEAKIKEFKDIVQALPQCNRDTLKFLLEHLLRVTKYSEKNRMHTANLAIVFGPTLLWAPAEQAHNIAIDCIQQNNVVDILLTEFKQIFTEDMKGKKKT